MLSPHKSSGICLALALNMIATPCLRTSAQAPSAQAGTQTTVTAPQAIAKGMDYLRKTQETDGSWNHYPAITALAVSGFLRNGKTEAREPVVAKGVQFLLRSAKPNGAIYSDADPARALPNYNTALAILALTLTKNAAYKPTIQKAQQFLEKSQFDEEEGVEPSDKNYGGIGYGSHQDRPDLSNLSMALEALKESGASYHAPVFQKAVTFLQRIQNRKASNDQEWAKNGPDDGGFVYEPSGENKGAGSGNASMGAMTYAGLESYIYCGITRNDPRAKAAWDWIRGHYTVAEHPGVGDSSLYYYYHTMSKTLSLYGQKVVKDTKGASHVWADDLSAALIARQHPDGSWVNTNRRYMENDPILVTSYSLIALAYCGKR